MKADIKKKKKIVWFTNSTASLSCWSPFFLFVFCFFRWSSKLSSSWKMIERVVGQGSWWYSMWGLSSAISLVLAMLLLTSSCWWDPSSTQTKCVRINCNKFAPTPCQFSFSFFCFSNRTVKMLPYFVSIFNLFPVDWPFYKIIKKEAEEEDEEEYLVLMSWLSAIFWWCKK